MIAMIEKFKSDDDGVSPVIGVILLVAVTVALVALATVIVFDIGSDVSDTADATVQLNGDTLTDADDNDIAGVQATVVRNENVESFRLESTGEEGPEEEGDVESFGEVGETVTLAEGEGTYTVIANLEDGSDEVLTSTER